MRRRRPASASRYLNGFALRYRTGWCDLRAAPATETGPKAVHQPGGIVG